VGASRRLRYANPAWERLTGEVWAKQRGLKLSAYRSATDLGQTLMPPPEVWAGETAQVRRALPGQKSGPPWWDITFVPLPVATGLIGVVGFMTQYGERGPRKSVGKTPASLASLHAEHAAHYHFDQIAGTSAIGERFVNLVRVAANTSVPVWLIGEAGSGKATTARILHHNGPTREKAFVALDAHGVQPYLLEAQLFGKGGAAFGSSIGTMALHDPAALPRDFQERLAQYFAKPDGPRIICTSAMDPTTDSRLIEGFATRFCVFPVRIPALRERLEDWPWFAERVTTQPLAEDLGAVLMAHDWPGNLREFAIVLRQAGLRAKEQPIAAAHLPRYLRERHLIATHPLPATARRMSLSAVLETVERRMIEDALLQCHGSVSGAAKWLDVPRATLLRKIAALKIATAKGGDA
jgi:DNA-binding NtrC family response regulator